VPSSSGHKSVRKKWYERKVWAGALSKPRGVRSTVEKMLALGHHSHGCENHESRSLLVLLRMRWEEHGRKNKKCIHFSLEDFMKTDLIADLCRYPRILLNWISDKQEM
jgi:hypothetical protein